MKSGWIGVFCLGIILPCARAQDYKLSDFEKVEKIDVHAHFESRQPSILDAARSAKFRFLSIEVERGNWESVLRQQEVQEQLHRQYADTIAYAGTFSMEGWDEPKWQDKVLKWIEKCRSQGSIAVKVWKNIGMEFRDRQGELVMIDNPRLQPIFQFLESQQIPLIAHLGEPRDCWLPLDKMATNNNRNYFAANPKYHMFLHPEMPSYEAQMASRDHLLEQHPQLKFIGCHLASIEWSVDQLARWLDRFPQAVVDTAARMGHLQHQAIQEREKVRRFFIRYQDRLLYGTDSAFRGDSPSPKQMETTDAMWRSDWKFLVSEEWMESSKVNGKFQGLKLPREVVNKLYCQNALQRLPGAFPKN